MYNIYEMNNEQQGLRIKQAESGMNALTCNLIWIMQHVGKEINKYLGISFIRYICICLCNIKISECSQHKKSANKCPIVK